MKAVQRIKPINQGNELNTNIYLLNNKNNNILADSVGGMEVSLNLEVLCNTNTTHARC